MNKIIMSALVGVVVVGGGAFYGGMKYSQNQAAAMRGARGAGAGGFGGGAGARGGTGANAGFATGQVLSKDDKGITIQIRDGGSKLIFLSDSTQVMKAVSGATQDLQIGQSVTVMGSTNSDGSITAQSVQIRPE